MTARMIVSKEPHPNEMNKKKQAELREMKLSDLARVSQIDSASFSNQWSIATFRQELLRNNRCRCYVLTFQSIVIGYAVIWYLDQEAEIGRLAIAKSCRRKGFGAAFLKKILGEMCLEKITEIHLEVRSSNFSARNLYASLGFREMGKRKNYYTTEREDAVLMTLFSKEEQHELV